MHSWSTTDRFSICYEVVIMGVHRGSNIWKPSNFEFFYWDVLNRAWSVGMTSLVNLCVIDHVGLISPHEYFLRKLCTCHNKIAKSRVLHRQILLLLTSRITSVMAVSDRTTRTFIMWGLFSTWNNKEKSTTTSTRHSTVRKGHKSTESCNSIIKNVSRNLGYQCHQSSY